MVAQSVEIVILREEVTACTMHPHLRECKLHILLLFVVYLNLVQMLENFKEKNSKLNAFLGTAKGTLVLFYIRQIKTLFLCMHSKSYFCVFTTPPNVQPITQPLILGPST